MDTTLTPLTVQLIMSLVIPIGIGIITKASLSSGVKAVLMVVFNAVAALVIANTVEDGGAVITQATFFQWLIGLAVSIAVYAGVYVPWKLTSRADGKLAPNFGIGPAGPER